MLSKTQYSRCVSTALLYCGTSEGFVIGTDSRSFNELTRKVESDDERKIFAFKNNSVSLVFAWAGVIKAGTEELSISLIDETNSILSDVDFRMFDESFNKLLQDRLSILKVNTIGKCATGVFLYFWKGAAMATELCVFKNGRCWDSRIIGSSAPNGEIDLVNGGVQPALFDKPISLNQAKNMIEDYIKECIADPSEEKIGGKVQIGRLTAESFDFA